MPKFNIVVFKSHVFLVFKGSLLVHKLFLSYLYSNKILEKNSEHVAKFSNHNIHNIFIRIHDIYIYIYTCIYKYIYIIYIYIYICKN